ncbi:MAG: type 4a pilus biogenesis protein PilO [Pseudomonadota bacterium]
MNFLEQLRNLDINDIGRWPLVFRGIFIILIFVGVTAGGMYYFVVKSKVEELEKVQGREQSLRQRFEAKQRLAANFDAYKVQLGQMEQEFGTMLRQLPGQTEVPNLLTDISQTGLAAGLEEELFQPSQEIERDFYAELPIRIRLNGSYHEFGQFVSGIASLPRIVTLHNITIKPTGSGRGSRRNDDLPASVIGNSLELDITAKTYRYLDDEDESTGQ